MAINEQAINNIAASLKGKAVQPLPTPTASPAKPALDAGVQALRNGFAPTTRDAVTPFKQNAIVDNPQQSKAAVTGASDLLERIFGAPAFLASGGNPLTGKPLVQGGGDIPRGFVDQVTEAVKPTVGAKAAPYVGLAAGFMEPFGSLGEAGKVTKTITELNDLKQAAEFAKTLGVAEDTIPQAAKAFVAAKTPEEAKSAYESVLKTQKTSKPVEELAQSLAQSGRTKEEFLRSLGESIGSADEATKTTGQSILDTLKGIGSAPGKFYDQAVSKFGKAGDKAPEAPFPVPPENSGNPEDAAISKLVQAITEAKPILGDIAEKQTAERAKRAADVGEIFKKGGGEQAYFNALGKLKGELTSKKVFSPIRDQLTTGEISSLFDKIYVDQGFNSLEKVGIADGLQRLLRGEIPEPQQIAHLEEVFGSDVVKAIQKHSGHALYGAVVDTLNIPRTLMTAFDMSAPFRQGLVASVGHPITAGKAFNEMFKQAFSQKNFDLWLHELKKSPDYQVMRRSGLYIADPSALAGGLNSREEGFISKLAERIPGIRASQRAYLAYLNKLRVDVFRNSAKAFAEAGTDSKRDLESLAQFVNVSTGRGSLGRLERIAPELNTAFFSPRLIASRLSLLNPRWYAKQTPAVRKEAIKSFASLVGTGTTLLTLAKLGGAEVENDPRSTDFGKIKVGNTRWDIWGGFQQYARVFAQITAGQRKTAAGDIQDLNGQQFPFQTRADVAANFAAGKLAPIPALALELLKGQQVLGGDLTVSDTAIQNTVPLYVQDLAAAYKEGGPGRAVAAGVPGFFGVGVATYQPKKSKTAKKVSVTLGGSGKKSSTGKLKIKLGK